jgi:metal-responsive CopG/Arc/MetJ family transcriptional regulator
MDAQLTLRLPAALARALGRVARQRGVLRSQLVREALEAYLSAPDAPDAESLWRQAAPLVGSVRLTVPGEAEDLAARLRAHNWRE